MDLAEVRTGSGSIEGVVKCRPWRRKNRRIETIACSTRRNGGTRSGGDGVDSACFPMPMDRVSGRNVSHGRGGKSAGIAGIIDKSNPTGTLGSGTSGGHTRGRAE